MYESFDALEADYVEGALHPGDLKHAVARAINAMIQPVRDHFASNPEAAALLKTVRGYRITR